MGKKGRTYNIEDPERILTLRREAEQIKRSIAHMSENADLYPGARLRGTPGAKGRSADPIANYVIAKERLETAFVAKLAAISKEMFRVEKAIGRIQDADVRMILRMRLCDGLSWGEIGDRMCADRRTVARKYQAALGYMPVRKRISKYDSEFEVM